MLTGNRREACEEIFQSGIAFNVVNQRLDRNAGSLKARSAAELLGIHPDDVIQPGSLFARHTSILSSDSDSGAGPLAWVGRNRAVIRVVALGRVRSRNEPGPLVVGQIKKAPLNKDQHAV